MRIIKKLLGILSVEGNTKNNGLENDTLTNEGLLKQLLSHFKERTKEESVGRRLIYPMSFNIIMEQEDYNKRKEYFPYVLPEIVASFYSVIDDMKMTYTDYRPAAKYWHFQFSGCKSEIIETDGLLSKLVRKGHIAVIAHLVTFDLKEARNISSEKNLRMSLKLDDSNVMHTMNVNMSAISNVDIIGDNIFTCRFDYTLSQDPQKISDNFNFAEVNGIAELSYSRGGHNYHFIMKDNLIHISGKNEMRKGRSFFIIESSEIKDSHVQIKYLPSEKKFQIAAYGPTRLNSRKITESSGGDVYWHDLANNSSIFINDEISVKFEIK